MKHTSIAALACAALLALPAAAQDDDTIVAIKAARVITVSGEEFSPGMVLIRNGLIEAVGPRIELPAGTKVLDRPTSTLMPGLVNLRTRLSLPGYRRGGNNAHRSTADELFPRDGAFLPALESGFVALGLYPAGSGIPGEAAVIRPVNGPREAIVMDGAGYLRVVMTSLPGDKRTLAGTLKAADAAIKREEKARKAFEEKQKKAEAAAKKAAAAEKAKPGPKGPAPKGDPAPKAPPKGKSAPAKPKAPPAFKPPPVPPTLVPFVELLRKTETAPRVIVELNRASGLIHFADAVGETDFQPTYMLDRARGRFGPSAESDLFHVVERLGEEQATVIMAPLLSFEPYTKTRRNLPAELHRAGARLALIPDVDTEEGHRRVLAAVAELVREGLDRTAALRALTLVPAEILGLSSELGSLEKGRRADLILLSADPLEAGANVTEVLIDGETVWSMEERS